VTEAPVLLIADVTLVADLGVLLEVSIARSDKAYSQTQLNNKVRIHMLLYLVTSSVCHAMMEPQFKVFAKPNLLKCIQQ